MLKVVAALIIKDGNVLIAKRSTGDPNVLGKWEFPGGKVENGEDEFRAIEREMSEEFSVVVKARKFITNNIWEYPNKVVDLRLYECEYVSGKLKLHDHSEYKWVEIFDLLDYDLASADIPLAEYLNSNKYLIDNLVIGRKYTNNQICKVFRCDNSNGIRPSSKTNTIVIICKHNDPSYTDEWNEEGILNYTGMGLVGDQTLTGRNRTLANSKKDNKKVYLFESYKDNEYYFIGEVELCGEIYFDKAFDKENNLRTVIKFPFRKLNDVDVIIPIEDIEYVNNNNQKIVKKMSMELLKDKIKFVDVNVKTKEVKVTYRERNPHVAEYTKKRTNGICDLCGNKAPFNDKLGFPYLEEHHVITLADGGPDDIYNTVAICPNCHRKMHVLQRKRDMDKLQSKILDYLLSNNDTEKIELFKELFK